MTGPGSCAIASTRSVPTGVLQGFTNGGYRLVYTDTPTPYLKAIEKASKGANLLWSGGLTLDKDGAVTQVLWDSAAFNAGLAVGQKIVSVNGVKYDAGALRDAIRAASGGKAPIQLIVSAGDQVRTVPLKWSGGLRYPRLERTGTGPSTLDALLTPLR